MSSTVLVWGRDLKEAVWHRAAEDQKQKQYRASWRERVENVRLQWIDAMHRFCCGFNDYVMIHFYYYYYLHEQFSGHHLILYVLQQQLNLCFLFELQ